LPKGVPVPSFPFFPLLSFFLFGIATSWGAPVEPERDAQMTSEVFYRLQMTDNLQVTPALQVTRNPSFNDLKSTIYVGSVLRMRLAF
jgi:porin